MFVLLVISQRDLAIQQLKVGLLVKGVGSEEGDHGCSGEEGRCCSKDLLDSIFLPEESPVSYGRWNGQVRVCYVPMCVT